MLGYEAPAREQMRKELNSMRQSLEFNRKQLEELQFKFCSIAGLKDEAIDPIQLIPQTIDTNETIEVKESMETRAKEFSQAMIDITAKTRVDRMLAACGIPPTIDFSENPCALRLAEVGQTLVNANLRTIMIDETTKQLSGKVEQEEGSHIRGQRTSAEYEPREEYAPQASAAELKSPPNQFLKLFKSSKKLNLQLESNEVATTPQLTSNQEIGLVDKKVYTQNKPLMRKIKTKTKTKQDKQKKSNN